MPYKEIDKCISYILFIHSFLLIIYIAKTEIIIIIIIVENKGSPNLDFYIY